MLTESAMQTVMECGWPAVLRVMTFLRNDLRKLSNESLCRSPERLGPIHSIVNSKQTRHAWSRVFWKHLLTWL